MQTLIITGGSSGIGAAIVDKFLKNNYLVHNLDLKDNPIFQINSNYVHHQIDITNNTKLENIIVAISKDNQISTVIANAGKHLSANIENTTDDELHTLLNLNLLSAYYLIKYTVPHMKKNGGSIITIGSDQSLIAKNNSTVYGMTKTALASLTKSIALDYAKHNIRANCIAAGTIDTPLYQEAIKRYSDKSGISLTEIEKSEAREQPIGRIGMPSEVAELAFFLSQDNVKYLTGTVIPIDGGYTTK